MSSGDEKRQSYRAWRLNAWASALLLVAIVFAANRLAREHLRLRVDLSEDQLFAPSPVGRRMLGELTDLLQVKAYFTGEVKLGPVQIAKRRLIDQLEEIEDASNGRLELLFADPNSSTEARVEAESYGIPPVPLSAMQGASQVTQDIYLGIVLRHRGREAVLPFVLPQSFEYGFLSQLQKLVREEVVGVGFLIGDGAGAVVDRFDEARRLLEGQYRVREVLDLHRGEPVPADVSVLVVARPANLHPRAAFEVDQFVQRGGRVLLCVDRVLVDLSRGALSDVETGLERVLAGWGVPLPRELVWDQARCNTLNTQETVQLNGESVGAGQKVRVRYPFWPDVDQSGMERSLPVTGQLAGADFFWAHAIGDSPPVGSTLERQSLVRTSAEAWHIAAEEALNLDPRAITARSMGLGAQGDGAVLDLAVSLSGRFPSAFADAAPAPLDKLAQALYLEEVQRALEEGREPPPREVKTTNERVLDGENASQVVVVGDADWLTDGDLFTAHNQALFANLIDWLALEDELLALRARIPTERKIDDFLEEERRERGLVGLRLEGDTPDAAALARFETEAEQAAAWRRWIHMLSATAGALAFAFALGLAWRLCTRTPRIAAGGSP